MVFLFGRIYNLLYICNNKLKQSSRLIHGKGTGALRLAVRDYLRGHYYVKSYRDGMLEEGGHGVTVVELK